tara:strand:- start:653 stop:2398 length:1746 start_codon:yes stop_codon:yes gene_type:complete
MMGDLVVRLGLNSAGFTRGLNQGRKSLTSFSRSITGIGSKMFALGGSVLAPFGLAIKAGSDLEETMNKFNVVFGANAGLVKQWGDTFGSQVGRSKEQIASFMASNQDLLVPMGFEPGAATTMSKQITGLAVDLASFNNMQDADTLRDLQAALTGSGEVMKKYGVIVSEAAVKQQLLTMGLNPKKVTEAEKAQARFALIMAGTTAAQGDALRSSGSWANQMKALGAVITNVSGEIGQTLLPVVTPMLTSIKDMVKSLGGLIEKHKEYIPYVAGAAAALMAGGAAFIAIGGAAALAGVAMTGFATAASVVGTVMGVIFSPIGLVTAAVIGGAAAFVYYSGVGGKAIEYLKSIFPGLGGSAKETFIGIKLGLVRMFEDVKHFFTGVIPAVLMGFSDNWGNTFRTAADYVMTVFINMGQNIRNVMGSIWEYIASGGEGKLELAWVPLTEGFHNSMKEFNIPDRVKSNLEKSLEESLGLATLQRITKGKAKESGQPDMGTGFSIPRGGAAGGSASEPVGAAMRGSREAISTMLRSVNGSKGKIEQQQLKVAEKMEKNVGKMEKGIQKMTMAIKSGNNTVLIGRGIG